jgi:hypothetical protein
MFADRMTFASRLQSLIIFGVPRRTKRPHGAASMSNEHSVIGVFKSGQDVAVVIADAHAGSIRVADLLP